MIKPKSAVYIEQIQAKGIKLKDINFLLTFDNSDAILNELVTLFRWDKNTLDQTIESLSEDDVEYLNNLLDRERENIAFFLFKEKQKEEALKEEKLSKQSWLMVNKGAIIDIFIALVMSALIILLLFVDVPEKNQIWLQNIISAGGGYFISGVSKRNPQPTPSDKFK